MTSHPLAGLERTVGKEMFHKIQTSNILCVGAGGIGCELLKDMALSGFRRIQVIDLDTIDVSNLNRQLLFRGRHVGMPKCTVACEVAATMVPPLDLPSDREDSTAPTSATTSATTNDDAATDSSSVDKIPDVSYQAHHGNVCDTSKFNVPFIKKFDLVVNALDNVEARRRVNRLCLAADVPLIEAGTTGYLGQVTVIHKNSGVACYECVTQETQKVYPICTIRSTPSMPVHTIVWSKELYKLLFHSKADESMLYEDPNGEEPSTYMAAVTRLRELLKSGSACDDDDVTKVIRDTLNDLYSTEIQKQLDMGRYKAAKKTPTCLETSVLDAGMASSTHPPSSTTEIWSPQESVAALVACLRQARGTPDNELLEEFDKDDELAMRFVTAASNLRSSVFGIEPLQSLYSAKGIAGNIIPAIATTNAICAGLQILQAFAILKQQIQRKKEEDFDMGRLNLNLSASCYYINCIRNRTRNGLYLTASPLEKPNPNCFVCKNAIIPLALNVEEWTLRDFLAKIVKGRLGFEEPTLILQGDFIWEEGDGAEADFEANLPKTLSGLPCGGIRHGTVLEIDDNSQDLSIQVAVTHQDVWEGDEVPDFPFTIGAVPPPAKKTTTATNEEPTKGAAASAEGATTATGEASTASTQQAKDNDDDDSVMIIIDDDDDDNDEGGDSKPSAKRSIEDGDSGGAERPTKKTRLEEPSKEEATDDGIEVIEIE
eukprot:CAMPEP_0197186306 /NCGR_PEP_ID=MMETSP1423-20130617/13649_1 /TAXON_ID=476441 /ORGANISM="Pseudo-nitzschia heimii, Strain UNC1101" /LENGTH=713 /DNA_ID=CAMNT_0042637579 /DNA_START=102 /DNA_END=2243 /DNA_ORIENTATION=+